MRRRKPGGRLNVIPEKKEETIPARQRLNHRMKIRSLEVEIKRKNK
jgi:hypothetical protein